MLEAAGLVAAAAAAGLLALRILHPLPPHRPPSPAAPDGRPSALERAVTPAAAAHPGLSGIAPLADPLEAFAARILLARAAERTLDAQYYIWQRDTTGTLLLGALLDAADRGVRVRLLVDDNGIAGMDDALAALSAHPRAEVRLFNPFTIRRGKPLLYLTDFRRLNRRMHNKSLTADGIVTIVGGRNIGDAYFGAHDGDLFADLDLLAAGPAAGEVAADFERYWRSGSAYPAEDILPPPRPDAPARLAAEAAAIAAGDRARAYVEAVATTRIVRDLIDGRLPLEWAPVTMVSDDPDKGLGRSPPGGTLAERLAGVLGRPEREVEIVSAYFVPGRAGTAELARLARDGIAVSVLTNGLATTDVALVHAGYARRRRALLAAGVRLFEMRPEPASRRDRLHLFRPGSRISRPGSRISRPGPATGPVFRAQGSSLHAKTFATDRRRLFAGSFNFDPRSVQLNTEIGFVVESERLAARLARAFEEEVPLRAYEVRLGARGRLEWVETHADGRQTVHRQEPGAGPLARALVGAVSRLPIEWML